AFRDVAFAAGNLAIYAATTKLFYMPLASLFGFGLASHPSSAFAIRIAHSYEYAFNTDLRQMLSRLGEIAKASGDLWFLPQAEIHIGLGAAILLALVLAAAHGLIRRRKVGDIGLTEPNTNGWLGSRAWPVHGMVVVG